MEPGATSPGTDEGRTMQEAIVENHVSNSYRDHGVRT